MEDNQGVATQDLNTSVNANAAHHFQASTSDTSKAAPETVAPKGYLPFVEAREFAVSLKLSTRKEWRSYVKAEISHLPPKPTNVPSHPDGIYKVKGWQGWKYWLGTVEAASKLN